MSIHPKGEYYIGPIAPGNEKVGERSRRSGVAVRRGLAAARWPAAKRLEILPPVDSDPADPGGYGIDRPFPAEQRRDTDPERLGDF